MVIQTYILELQAQVETAVVGVDHRVGRHVLHHVVLLALLNVLQEWSTRVILFLLVWFLFETIIQKIQLCTKKNIVQLQDSEEQEERGRNRFRPN